MADQLSRGLWYPTEPEPELDHTLDKTVWVTCPHCIGTGKTIIVAVTAGEPQPEESLDCLLCRGFGTVAESTAALYEAEGLDAVLALRLEVLRDEREARLAKLDDLIEMIRGT